MAKILIVDDEEQLRDVLKTVLQDEGHEVVEAGNGNAAMEQFRLTPTELIITDIVMPDKEGLETIIDFRRIYPQVKIIAMSGGWKEFAAGLSGYGEQTRRHRSNRQAVFYR